MSCNTFIPIMDLVREVEALLAANYIDKDDPRITNGVFTNPTIREGFLLDVAAREEFCRLVQECGLDAPEGKIWVSRPLSPDTTLISYTDSDGVVQTKWLPAYRAPDGKMWLGKPTEADKVLVSYLDPADEEIKTKWGDLLTTNIRSIMQDGRASRSQEDINRNSIYLSDYGAVDGQDATEMMTKAINAHPLWMGGFRINIGPGRYYLTKPIYLTRPIELNGTGINSTILDFSRVENKGAAPYSAAIVVVHPLNISGVSELSDPIVVPAGQVISAGINAKIKNMTVHGQGKAHPENFNGITINAPTNVSRVEVTQFSGHGYFLTANVNPAGYGGTHTYGGIANHSEFLYCQAFNNGKNGIHILGSDANTFHIQQCLLAANGGWGIFDHSLLGGVVIGCEVDSSGIGAYGGSGYGGTPATPSRTLWLGNYSEGNGSPVHYAVNDRNIIIGSTGGLPAANQNYLGAVTGSGFLMQKPLNIADGDVQAYDIGGTTGRASRLDRGLLALRIYAETELFAIGAYTRTDAAQFRAGTVVGMEIPVSTTSGLSTLGVPNFPSGLTLTPYVKFTSGDAPPSTGQYHVGHIRFNSYPATGRYSYWVCVEAGTPGVWKGVGLIKSGEDAPAREAGATTERPEATKIGQQYFDTTLGKPTWYGSDGYWVDATGARVPGVGE